MDLSFSEIVVVAVIAFLVFGPEDFVRRMRQAGEFLGRMKNQSRNFHSLLESEMLPKKISEEIRDVKEVVDSQISAIKDSNEKP